MLCKLCIYISGTLQHIILFIIVLDVKPKDFDSVAYANLFVSSSWKNVNNQKEMTLENEQEKRRR